LQITYRNSLADLALLIVRHQLRRPLPILGMAMISAAIVQTLLPVDPVCGVCTLISATLWGGAIFLMLCLFLVACQLHWLMLHGGGSLRDELTVELGALGLVGTTSIARSEVRWSGVSGISVMGQRIFLDAGVPLVFCVPARAFGSMAEFERFIECARKFRASALAEG